MKSRIYLIVILLALGVGCGGTTPVDPPTPTAAGFLTPTMFPGTLSPTSVFPAHPPDTWTGIPEIDLVVGAYLSNNLSSQKRLFNYRFTPCTHEDGLGGPPKCRPEEPEGKPVEVISFYGPEGDHMRADEADDWTGINVVGLYAVFTPSENIFVSEDYPIGTYAIAFVMEGDQGFSILHVEDGRVVRFDWDPGIPGQGLDVGFYADEIILGPVEYTPAIFLTPTLFPGTISPTSEFSYPTHPAETRTGILQIDQVIDVFLLGDAADQWELLTFIEVGCTYVDGYREPPPCREGEEEGTLVEVFPFLGTVGSHSRRDELEDWGGIEVIGLYAVFTPSENVFTDEYYPVGEYVVAFMGSSGRDVQIVHVNAEGQIVRIDWQWVDTNTGFSIEYSANEVILGLPD